MGLAPVLAQVSIQLYWNSGHPYYWDAYHHRHYVAVAQVPVWYRQHDPAYWRVHQRDWNRDHSHFAQQWRRDHGG